MSISAQHDAATITRTRPVPGDDAALMCPGCDYDLRGLDHARCPECGKELDLASLQRAQANKSPYQLATPLSPGAIAIELLTLAFVFNALLFYMVSAELEPGVLVEYPIDLLVCIALSRRWARGYTAFRAHEDGRSFASPNELGKERILRPLLLAWAMIVTWLVPPMILYVYLHHSPWAP